MSKKKTLHPALSHAVQFLNSNIHFSSPGASAEALDISVKLYSYGMGELKEVYYFSYFAHGWATKNKLEKEVSDYFYSRTREIVRQEDLPGVLQGIKDKVAELCRKYPRCDPFEATFPEDLGKKGDYILRLKDKKRYDRGFVNFFFYVNNHYKTKS